MAKTAPLDTAEPTPPAFEWPMEFALSRPTWTPDNDAVTTLKAREPKMRDCLATGILDDGRSENMVEFMGCVFALPAISISKMALPDYVRISRKLNEFLSAPFDGEAPPADEWPVTIDLAKPVTIKDKTTTKLTLREPTTGDCLKAGLLDPNPLTTNLVKIIEIVGEVDRDVIRGMSLSDFSKTAGVLNAFLSRAVA